MPGMLRHLAILAAVAAAVAPHAGAQEAQRIAVVVNDEVVSTRDAQRRLDLIIRSAGMPDTADVRQRTMGQALQTLIEERLQIQEAKRRNVSVTDGEMGQALRQIESSNNMKPGELDGFLAKSGIDKESLTAKVRAEIAWTKLVRARILPTITVSEEEVDAAIARLRLSAGQDEVLASEIFLAVDNPGQDDEIRAGAQRLVDQLRGGADFAAVARQFSQGVTAAAGGELGWLLPGTLAEEVDAALRQLRTDSVSDPIRTIGGYYVVKVRDRRRVAITDGGDTQLTLKQVVFPLADTASQAEADSMMAQAASVAKGLSGCDAADAVAKDVGSRESGSLGTVRLADLPAKFRTALANLAVDKATPPLRTERAVHVIVVCARVDSPQVKAERERIRQNLLTRRVAMVARRYMRDLRRDAMVEFR